MFYPTLQKITARTLAIFVGVLVLASCATAPSGGLGWQTVLEGGNMSEFNAIGTANWRVVDGSVQADKGSGFLVSKQSFDDFEMRVEFWADADANSGIFIRMQDTINVTAGNSYEVNIFDKRPGQEYATGAIVDVAKIATVPKAGGQWNVFEITAKGGRLTVKLNGAQTVSVEDNKHARGPFALQYAPGVVKDSGTIKFRKVQVRPL